MTKLESGAIVLINFPFTDLQSSKVRPALVLSAKGEDVIIVGIFSKVSEELRESWIKIDEFNPAFHQTGLKRKSIIKTEKIAVVHQSLIRKKLGYLLPELMQRVKQILRKTLEIELKSSERCVRSLATFLKALTPRALRFFFSPQSFLFPLTPCVSLK